MRSLSVLLVSSVTLLAATGCGRIHLLRDGDYSLAVREVLRDDCNLVNEAKAVSTGTLVTTGHQARFVYQYLDVEMVGSYLSSVEELALDGTAVNVTTRVRGAECLLDTVSLHLKATAEDATHFNGAMSFMLDARQADACVCQLWLTVEGTHAP